MVRGSETLEHLIERADLVIVITDVNSHSGVLGARRLAKQKYREMVLLRRFGVAGFRRVLAQFGLDRIPALAATG